MRKNTSNVDLLNKYNKRKIQFIKIGYIISGKTDLVCLFCDFEVVCQFIEFESFICVYKFYHAVKRIIRQLSRLLDSIKHNIMEFYVNEI